MLARNALYSMPLWTVGLLRQVLIMRLGPVCALNIPAGQWHTLRALDPGTVILEMKDGQYEPIQECDIIDFNVI